MQKSLWFNNKISNKKVSKLDRDIECDILIIGGGMAGLSSAISLSDCGKKIVLIDKDKCGCGATSLNTGKLTWMQDLIYSRITKNYNNDIAMLYFKSQIDSIKMVVDRVKKYKIDCHLVKTKSYVFSNNNSDCSRFADEMNFYKLNGIEYTLLDKLPLKYPAKYVLETKESYVFNPYEYLVGIKNMLLKKIDIYENTRCISVNKEYDCYNVIVDNDFNIRCKYVVVASHYPMFIIPFLTPFKTKVEKFFIGASKSDLVKDIQMISCGKDSISMRYYNNGKNKYLLYGRRNHNTTKNLDVRDDYRELNLEYQKYFGKNIEYFYHTHDVMTFDGLPYICEVDTNLFVCTGFNKWGNTNGTLAGIVIDALINKKDCAYIDLFNPKNRLCFDKIKNLFLYNIEVGSRYILNMLSAKKRYYGNDVNIVYIDGRRCGVYTDKEGKKYVVSNVCPHMKCNLVFNYIDKTWDCPCHASRFDINGNIICGPAVYDIKINKQKY